MKITAFSKTALIRIIATSLMLSVYIIALLLNYASREITAGNFFATLAFLFALTVFLVLLINSSYSSKVLVNTGEIVMRVKYG